MGLDKEHQNKKITVEVAYARPDQQCIMSLSVDQGCSIETAIDRSGILERFPEIDLIQQTVGIFGQPRAFTDILQEGDRIEIYRSLFIEPKKARRKKAAQ